MILARLPSSSAAANNREAVDLLSGGMPAEVYENTIATATLISELFSGQRLRNQGQIMWIQPPLEQFGNDHWSPIYDL
jgi:hypothetical protein